MTQPIEVLCQLAMPNVDHLFDHIKENARRVTSPKQVIRVNSNVGQRVAICGAGPSLRTTQVELRERATHQIWGCNSALPYLKDRDIPVTHGFGIDQGLEMLEPEEWGRTFDVTYLIASSVHPDLVAHLLKANRRVKWFHNYLGRTDPEGWVAPPEWVKPAENCGYEMYLYQSLYPGTVQVGYGLNAVPRAICLALWMGFEHIRVYGADCAAQPDAPVMPSQADPDYPAWLDQVIMYADGRTARRFGPNAIMVEHELGPHRWHTRADMVISAKHLVDLLKAFPDRLELVGDTLPNAMKDQPDEYFAGMPHLSGQGGIKGFVLRA